MESLAADPEINEFDDERTKVQKLQRKAERENR